MIVTENMVTNVKGDLQLTDHVQNPLNIGDEVATITGASRYDKVVIGRIIRQSRASIFVDSRVYSKTVVISKQRTYRLIKL